MSSNNPHRHSSQEIQETSSDMRPISLLPFPVQLRNILPAEITVRRFPIAETDIHPFTKLQITNIIVDHEKLKAQAVLEVDIDFPQGPRSPF